VLGRPVARFDTLYRAIAQRLNAIPSEPPSRRAADRRVVDVGDPVEEFEPVRFP